MSDKTKAQTMLNTLNRADNAFQAAKKRGHVEFTEDLRWSIDEVRDEFKKSHNLSGKKTPIPKSYETMNIRLLLKKGLTWYDAGTDPLFNFTSDEYQETGEKLDDYALIDTTGYFIVSKKGTLTKH